MNQELLNKYAAFTVQVGVNVQKGQTLIIRCPVEGAYFGRACMEAAYKAGARDVVIRWEDEKAARIRMELGEEEALSETKPYELRSYLDYAESEGGCCLLAIHASDPEIFKGLDTAKINRVSLAKQEAMKSWREYTMKDRVQWCVVAIPTPAWAASVFPGMPEDEAQEKLWSAIFDVCRVTGGDPVSAWKEHVAKTSACRDKLNELQLESIHMTSANGTDLTVGLCGDLTFGRTVHSLIETLCRFGNVRFVLISPDELKTPQYVIDRINATDNCSYVEVRDLASVIGDLDVLYMTRVQKERFFNEDDYLRLRDTYILDEEKLQLAKPSMAVLHPLPRVNEIAVDVDDDPRAAYFEQVKNGMLVRMALESTVVGDELPGYEPLNPKEVQA